LLQIANIEARSKEYIIDYFFSNFLKFIMSQCARPDCQIAAKSSCSGCGREQYCGSVCQKQDWKAHKSLCAILKKLPNKLQSYDEAARVIKEIMASNKGNDIRVLEHLLSYADNQFGQQVPGRDYRKRGDGQRIATDWDVDIKILLKISTRMTNFYFDNLSLSPIIRDNKMFPHLERSLNILKPWMVVMDSDASNQSNSLNLEEIDYLLNLSYHTERNMALSVINRNQLDVAEGHSHRCLAIARRLRVEGEDKVTSIFEALGTCVDVRQRKGDYSGAVTFAEEAYNVVVIAYDCVHPQVQNAAGLLIACLIHNGDLFNAERFAQQTYENLRDRKNGMNQEGEEVAMGSYNLADVIYRQEGDLLKAEKLAREALRIRFLLYSSDEHMIGGSCDLLARILKSQGKFEDETKRLFERSLAIFIRMEGPDGANTAVVNINIGSYYHDLARRQPTVDTKRKYFLISKSHIQEGFRIQTKILGPTHPRTVQVANFLSSLMNELSGL
jgi:tetratricopeptide (TPR) repeat protein